MKRLFILGSMGSPGAVQCSIRTMGPIPATCTVYALLRRYKSGALGETTPAL